MTDPSTVPDDGTEQESESVLDALRASPVGTNDPNIVGDVGPLDIPPGQDPDGVVVQDEDPT